MRFIELPCMLLGCGAAIAAICGGVSCMRCRGFRIRDISCVKWFMRKSGQDSFDDFDLLVHVHEMVNLQMKQKTKLKVRVTAGQQVAKTGKSSKGIFQCSLTISVAQGTQYLLVDLITESEVLLAQLKLHVEKDVLTQKKAQEKVYPMKERAKGCPLNPTVRLTLCQSNERDLEDPLTESLLTGKDPETVMLMQQKLIMAEEEVKNHDRRCRESMSEMEVLMQAGGGPVETFGSFGSTTRRYCGVMGPPLSRRFFLGIWKDQQEYEGHVDAQQEIDVLKIHSVQADPGRSDVFVISYFDQHRVSKKLTCRIIDRPVKLWVEMLHLIITKAHEHHRAHKKDKKLKSGRD